MPNLCRLFALSALAGGVVGCSAETGDSIPGASGTSSSAVSVPACAVDSYYCFNEPFALGAWAGDTGPFAALVLSDKLCGDYGYCFVGHLNNGTRIEGSYFDRPQLTHFGWPGAGLSFAGYSLEGDVLELWDGPEEKVAPVATLHRVASFCDFPSDCDLQSLDATRCVRPVTTCKRLRCTRACARP